MADNRPTQPYFPPVNPHGIVSTLIPISALDFPMPQLHLRGTPLPPSALGHPVRFLNEQFSKVPDNYSLPKKLVQTVRRRFFGS